MVLLFLDVFVGLQEFERKKWQFLDSSSLGKCVDSVIREIPSERNTYNKSVPLSKEISPLKNHSFLRKHLQKIILANPEPPWMVVCQPIVMQNWMFLVGKAQIYTVAYSNLGA